MRSSGRTAEDIISQGDLLAGDKFPSGEAKNAVEQEATEDTNIEKEAIENEAVDNGVPEDEASGNNIPEKATEGSTEKRPTPKNQKKRWERMALTHNYRNTKT